MLDIRKKGEARHRRHRRVRKKVFGTPERPRLSVFRSHRHVYAQIIDDVGGCTLASASTRDQELRGQITKGSNRTAAKMVGKLLSERARALTIQAVVFDKGGYLYHGRVASVAEGAREGGLLF